MILITKPKMTVVIPIEDFDLTTKNIIQHFLSRSFKDREINKLLSIKFLSFMPEGALDSFAEFKEEFGFWDVEVLYTRDKTLGQLNFAKSKVTTEFWCIKTITQGETEFGLMSSSVEYLSSHITHCITAMERDNLDLFVPLIELVNMEDYNNPEPEFVDLLDQSNFRPEYIKLDYMMLRTNLDFSFESGIIEHENGVQFAPGAIVHKIMMSGKVTGFGDYATMREFIRIDQIRKNLKIIVEGNHMKAIPA